MNFFKFNLKNEYIKYFFILGWISIWSTLSFNPINFLFFKYIHDYKLTNLNIVQFIDLMRGISSLIYFPIIVIIFLSLMKMKDLRENTNLIFLSLIFYFLIQIIGNLNTNNADINIYFVINSINVVITTLLIKTLLSNKELNLFLKITIFICCLVFLFFTSKYFYVVFKYATNFYGAWGSVDFGNFDVPRPTGLARFALIILIFLINTKFENKIPKLLSLYFSIFLITLIFLFGSRTIIFITFIYFIIHIFYYKIYEAKKLVKLFQNFLVVPFVIILIFNFIQNLNYRYNVDNMLIDEELKIIDLFKNTDQTTRNFPKKRNEYQTFSSGRKDDWKNIISYNQNIFLGNGAMGDRYLINQSASNILMYSYASAGILGLLLISFISLATLYRSLNFIFKNQSNNLKNEKFIASSILISILLRSLLESSFAIFGVDLLLFSLCLAILTQKRKIK